MRVVTRFGFGEAESLNQTPVAVLLDNPFLDQSKMNLEKGEVFLFSEWAVVRVLNIQGSGFFSNLQFYGSRDSAAARLKFPAPPDETTFFLNLRDGRFRVNQELGILAQHSLIMRPWLDRWAQEVTDTFTYISEAREAFQKEKEQLAGVAGISTAFHLDMEGGGNLLGFYLAIAPPQGVIFEKHFPFKIH